MGTTTNCRFPTTISEVIDWRRLAKALTAEDLRDLAIACKVQDAASRQLPGLLDALALEHYEALLDLLELRINEVAKEIAS